MDMYITATVVCIFFQEHRRKKHCRLSILQWLEGVRNPVAYLTPGLISACATNFISLRMFFLLAPHSRTWPHGLALYLSLRLQSTPLALSSVLYEAPVAETGNQAGQSYTGSPLAFSTMARAQWP